MRMLTFAQPISHGNRLYDKLKGTKTMNKMLNVWTALQKVL